MVLQHRIGEDPESVCLTCRAKPTKSRKMPNGSNPNVNLMPLKSDGDLTELHVADCPYLPFQDTFPEPGEERPGCACPPEHLARAWKLRWMMVKRRVEELRGISALVLGQAWRLAKDMGGGDVQELERLIRLWEEESGESLLEGVIPHPAPTPDTQIHGNPTE